MKPEQRQSQRIQVEPLAYIHLGPDNGGIILNVSEGGLCFHSTAAVDAAGTIRFWFAARNHRIEGSGELVWTDETQRRGGLRFTNLTLEAREQLHNWISHSTLAVPVVDDLAAPPPAARENLEPVVNRPGTRSTRELRARLERPAARTGGSRLRGFSGGLLTGLMISTVLAAIVLLSSYHREVGESLVQLGERLGAKPRPQAVPASAPVLPPKAETPARVAAPPPAKKVEPPAEKKLELMGFGSSLNAHTDSARSDDPAEKNRESGHFLCASARRPRFATPCEFCLLIVG